MLFLFIFSFTPHGCFSQNVCVIEWPLCANVLLVRERSA